ncbi:MAG: lysophospholipid acyltransferase family protein [Acidimicrobiales bacterium]
MAAVELPELEPSRASQLFYESIRRAAMGIFRRGFDLEVSGLGHVPAEGGFVLAPGGHRSIIDTPVVAAASPRMLRYMGAENYFAKPGLGWFLRSVGGFPVERATTDRAAMRIAQALLEAGEPLVVFPESTRFSGPTVQPLKEGAAFLAARARVPIVPVGIGGAEAAWPKGQRLPRRAPMALVIGEPIDPPERADGERVKRSVIRSLTADLQDRLQTLFDEAQSIAS